MRQYFTKHKKLIFEILLIFLIVFTAFITRVWGILNIPIFTDEAIYIRWAQIGLNDPMHRFISLTDGKQPLFTWLMYPFLIFINDPLIAGRMVSVFAGIISSVFIYLIGRTLFSIRTGIISSFIYIFSAFTIIYDRLALMDSLLACFALMSMYFQILQVRHLRLDLSMILGIVMGLGMLTKSSAELFIYLIPFSLMILRKNDMMKFERLFKFILFSSLSIGIALLIYNILRLSPFFYIIDQKNHSFIMSFSEFFKDPFRLFFGNLRGLFGFLTDYITWPFFILIIARLIPAFIKRQGKILFLFIWFLFPFISLSFFGIVLFPRFILFMVMPLFIISADLIAEIFDRKYARLLVIGFLISPVFNSIITIISPVNAKIPNTDRNQLFNDWPSGWGVKEAVAYFEREAEDKKIVIGTEGTFGLNPAVYEIYLKNNPNVEIFGFWPVGEVPEILFEKSENTDTYLVFKESQKIPESWPLKLVKKIRRGTGNTFLLVYKVEPKKAK